MLILKGKDLRRRKRGPRRGDDVRGGRRGGGGEGGIHKLIDAFF